MGVSQRAYTTQSRRNTPLTRYTTSPFSGTVIFTKANEFTNVSHVAGSYVPKLRLAKHDGKYEWSTVKPGSVHRASTVERC